MDSSSDFLPLELVLIVATFSPKTWFSLVRSLQSLSLYYRFNRPFRESLRKRFSKRCPTPKGFETVLPDGTRHGLCMGWYKTPDVHNVFPFGPRIAMHFHRLGQCHGPFFNRFETHTLEGSYSYGSMQCPVYLRVDSEGKWYKCDDLLHRRTETSCPPDHSFWSETVVAELGKRIGEIDLDL